MGTKDVTVKQLLDFEDVFADVVNVLLFDGEEIIKPEDLEATGGRSTYKDEENKLRWQERDVAKIWKNGQIRIAFFGLENQSYSSRIMPLRVIGYDGATYRSEINNLSLEEQKSTEKDQSPLRIYPVVTLVLYFDSENRWFGPKNLSECFSSIPPKLKPFINDYKINVIDIAWLPEGTIKKFKSDFRFLADYYRQVRLTGNWIPMDEDAKHVKELMDLFTITTKDDRFEQMYELREEGVNNMRALALDYLAENMVKDIVEESRNQWQEEGVLKSIYQMIYSGAKAKEISNLLKLDLGDVKKYIQDFKENKNTIIKQYQLVSSGGMPGDGSH